MTKNVKILGTTYNGVDTLNAKDASTNVDVKFVETSDANAAAADIKRDKTAYVNGQKVVGTSDAIVPEGEYNIEIQNVTDEITEDITNFETVNLRVVDGNGNYLEDQAYYKVNGALYKEEWPDVPSEGYYYFYSTAHPIEYPSSEGIYKATKDDEYSYHFDIISNGYYQIKNNSISELGTEPVYFLYDDGQETDEILLYHSSDTPRSDLVTDGKALKISYVGQDDCYEYKTIKTYPQADGTYTYTAATDTFVTGGGGGPSTSGLYSYKNSTFTEVTSEWLMNFGSGDYTDLGSNTTYYLYNSNGPAAMPLADSHMWYIPGSGNMPEQLSAGTWHQSNGNDPVKLTNGHYNIDGTNYNSVATYPQADGNYAYTKSTDSFTNAPPAPSGTLEETLSGENKSFDVTNYATIDITLTDIDGNPITTGNQKLYYMGGSGLNSASSGVYSVDGEGAYAELSLDTSVLYDFQGVDADPVFNKLAKGVYCVWNDEGQYAHESITEDQPGVYSYDGTSFGSSGIFVPVESGHYHISDGVANTINSYPDSDGAYIYHSDDDSFEEADIPVIEDDTYYYGHGDNLEYASGLHIINPEDGKAEDLPATGLLRFGSTGWNDYELIDEGNYYISDDPLVNTTIAFDDSGNASSLSDGQYNISGGYASIIGSGYYQVVSRNIFTLDPCTLITGEDSSTVLNEGLWNIYDQGGSGWRADLVSDGYYRINNGEITDWLDPGAYVLAEDGPTKIEGAASGVYFIDGTSFTVVDEGYYSIGSAGQMPQVITNTLLGFYDQGQVETFEDLAVGGEKTITLVTGYQYKVTRLN